MLKSAQVSIVRAADDIEKGVSEALSLLRGIQELIPKDTKKVLIKPNICFAYPASTGITTEPLLVKFLAKELKI